MMPCWDPSESRFSRPWSSSTTSSAIRVTPASWVAITKATPCSERPRMTARRSSADRLSSSAVGSSATTIAGPAVSTCANAARCCSPPDSSSGRWSRRCAIPSASRSSSAPGPPARFAARAAKRRCSSTVRYGTKLSEGRWKTNPTVELRTARRRLGDMAARLSPFTSTFPLVGRSSPARRRRSEDFPLPDAPTTAATAPRRNERSTPRRAWTCSVAVA